MDYGETFTFLRPSGVSPEAGETVCRARKFGGLFMLAIVAVMAAVPVHIWLNESTMWVFDILLVLWLLLFGLVTWVVFRAAVAAFGPKNWVLRIRADGVMLKFRSYLNAESGVDDETVVFIHFREIAGVSVLKEREIVPGSEQGDEIILGTQSLDFTLRNPDHAALLSDRVAAERARLKTRRSKKGQFVHCPVTVMEGNIVRVKWRSRSDHIRPSVNRVMAVLAKRLRVVERDGGTTRIAGLPPQARDERLRDLIARGERMTAVKIVRETMALGLTEAVDYVNTLTAKEA